MLRSIAIATITLACVCCPAVHAQWKLQDSGTKASLRGVHYVGGGVVWASGTDGTVLRSEDSGYVWQGCAIPPGAEHLDFRAVQAFDENTAIVMSSGPGDQSRLYKTNDGCRSWKLLFINPDKDGFWDALKFSSRDRGILLGDPVNGVFSLFSTIDGGATWHRRVSEKRGPRGIGCKVDGFSAKRNEAVFAASNGSLLALNGPFLIFVTGGAVTRMRYTDLFSLDGALCHESTHFVDLPLAHGNGASGAFASAAGSESTNNGNFPDRIIVVGGNYQAPNAAVGIAATVSRVGTPLFQTVRKAETPPHGYRSSVAYDSTAKTWITVGPNGTDVSTDDGRNWRPLTPTPQDDPGADRDWNALSLPFVVGPHGRIGKLRPSALPTPAPVPGKAKP